jgi:hypothetical protein
MRAEACRRHVSSPHGEPVEPRGLDVPKKFLPTFIPAPKTSRIIPAVLPAGNASGVVRKRGRIGASGGGLTRPAARGGRVQGFPCRHYGRCVLDEHIALRPMPPGAHSPHKAKSIRAERNGRKQKSPDGRPEGRITYLDERPPGRPSSRSLCRKADEISSLKWPDCESRAWRRWDACIRPKAASPPDGATGASRLMRAS